MKITKKTKFISLIDRAEAIENNEMRRFEKEKTQKEQELEKEIKETEENGKDTISVGEYQRYIVKRAELKGIKEGIEIGRSEFAKVSTNYSVGFKEGKAQAISEFKEKLLICDTMMRGCTDLNQWWKNMVMEIEKTAQEQKA